MYCHTLNEAILLHKKKDLIQTFKIEGMTCGGCVAKVKAALEKIAQIQEARVQLDFPQAEIKASKLPNLGALQNAIGHYQISPVVSTKVTSNIELPEKNITTYRPLLLIIGFIIGVTLLSQFPFDNFSWMVWMRHFMAGFFLVFAFFKLLNIQGFADSYRMYDTVAAKWKRWGYVYPFVELGLGILYLINIVPIATNLATFTILGISSIGVIRSVLDKRKIKCACLGDVFNLPMSTVTIVEDLTMVLMAGTMLLLS